jgi:hypothetical protein
METDPVSETLCPLILEYWTMDRSKNPVILRVIHHHQNPLECILWGDYMSANSKSLESIQTKYFDAISS